MLNYVNLCIQILAYICLSSSPGEYTTTAFKWYSKEEDYVALFNSLNPKKGSSIYIVNISVCVRIFR